MTITIDNRAVPKTTKAAWREWQERGLSSIELPASVQGDDPSATTQSAINLRQNLATAKIHHLSAIITELNHLCSGPERDGNGDQQKPTPHAYETCCNLLIEAAIDDHRQRSGSSTPVIAIPMGIVSPDGRGGLRVEWIRDNASVHLVIPPDETESAYIYKEEGEEYGTQDTGYALLAEALRVIH